MDVNRIREQVRSAAQVMAENYSRCGENENGSEKNNNKGAAYLRAVRDAPGLVATESDPLKFWKLTDGDVRAAADRMVEYWNHREKLFGRDRAYLPMNATGLGALDAFDVAALKTGYLAFVPPDADGHQVLVFDVERVATAGKGKTGDKSKNNSSNNNPNNVRMSRFRCIFYFCQVASERGDAQTEGLVLVRVTREPLFNKQKLQHFSDLLENIVPIKLHAFYCLLLPPTGSVRMFETTVAPLTNQVMTDYLLPLSKVAILSEPDAADKLQRLAAFGLQKDGLPETLGGTWSYALFDKWLSNRILHEEDRLLSSTKPAPTPTPFQLRQLGYKVDVTMTTPPTTPIQQEENTSFSSCLEDLAVAAEMTCRTQEERKARKRRMDAIYARKRRERDRVEFQALQQRCLNMSKENMTLEEDNKKLENILLTARREIALHEKKQKREPTSKSSLIAGEAASGVLSAPPPRAAAKPTDAVGGTATVSTTTTLTGKTPSVFVAQAAASPPCAAAKLTDKIGGIAALSTTTALATDKTQSVFVAQTAASPPCAAAKLTDAVGGIATLSSTTALPTGKSSSFLVAQGFETAAANPNPMPQQQPNQDHLLQELQIRGAIQKIQEQQEQQHQLDPTSMFFQQQLAPPVPAVGDSQLSFLTLNTASKDTKTGPAQAGIGDLTLQMLTQHQPQPLNLPLGQNQFVQQLVNAASAVGKSTALTNLPMFPNVSLQQQSAAAVLPHPQQHPADALLQNLEQHSLAGSASGGIDFHRLQTNLFQCSSLLPSVTNPSAPMSAGQQQERDVLKLLLSQGNLTSTRK